MCRGALLRLPLSALSEEKEKQKSEDTQRRGLGMGSSAVSTGSLAAEYVC